jgi:hypothetical protein
MLARVILLYQANPMLAMVFKAIPMLERAGREPCSRVLETPKLLCLISGQPLKKCWGDTQYRKLKLYTGTCMYHRSDSIK